MQGFFHRLRLLTEGTQYQLRRFVEHTRERPHQPFENEERRYEEPRDLFRMCEGNRTWGELAEHDVEIRDERDRENGAERDTNRQLDRERKSLYPSLEVVRERLFGERAEAE